MREHDQALCRRGQDEIADDLSSATVRDAHLAGAQLRRRGIVVGTAGQQLGDLGIARRLEMLVLGLSLGLPPP